MLECRGRKSGAVLSDRPVVFGVSVVVGGEVRD
jgi:hypothetical protein